MAIELKADVAAALVIDRAIPLGLAIVESLIAGMSADGAHVVVVRIDQLEDLRVEIRIWTDGALRKGEPNAKLWAGWRCSLPRSSTIPDRGRCFIGGSRAARRRFFCRAETAAARVVWRR